MDAKIAFDEDIKSLQISLQNVMIDYIEGGSDETECAEPRLIEWHG